MKFNPKLLREAVESAPDYPEAKAVQQRLYALKEQADKAYSEAAARIGEIWDREADKLFGDPLTVVRSVLAEVYSTSGIDVWLASPNRNLGGQVPAHLLSTGDEDVVVAEARRVAQGDPA